MLPRQAGQTQADALIPGLPMLPPTPVSPQIPLPASPDEAAIDLLSHASSNDIEETDLFPRTSTALSHLGQPLDPARVPLPASPPRQARLPSNRPANWVSSLPRSFSASFDDVPKSVPIQRGARRVSARLPSGPDPLRVGGRTVSGAMQHAMRPNSPELPSREDVSPLSDPDRSSSFRDTISSTVEPDGSTIHADNPLEPEGIDPMSTPDISVPAETIEFDLEEIRHSVLGMTDQDNDEVWMQYVRNQLGTLFPDFFHPAELSVSTGSIPLGRSGDGWAMVQDGAHQRPGTHFPAPLGGEVPNVREEISGLRDEIERLRGVVGGLADGLVRGQAVEQGDPEASASSIDQTGEVVGNRMGDGGETRAVQRDDREGLPLAAAEGTLEEAGEQMSLPVPFIKTAHLAVDLIRSLSSAVNAHGQNGSATGDQDQQAQDEAVFDESNLTALKELLLARLGDTSDATTPTRVS
ncbi:hypothetical protein DB88DRAFT_491345 [Papiliotrema laurentii]|uniref:Uncharacterized protein n=1 Tax=Papiliotrema laurentii TaxID=5418 RepID=A0AAD9CXT2_PAPLA|nr:hypothetical protein DB88DRAFT_491345 [Papiliotrema laurentii]